MHVCLCCQCMMCIYSSGPTGTSGIHSRISSSPTSIELTWTNIECLQQNGIITNFTIRYRLQGSSQDMTVNTQTAATSFNVTGLSAFTTYTLYVAYCIHLLYIAV